MQQTLEYIDDTFGGTENFVINSLGLDPETLYELRLNLLL